MLDTPYLNSMRPIRNTWRIIYQATHGGEVEAQHQACRRRAPGNVGPFRQSWVYNLETNSAHLQWSACKIWSAGNLRDKSIYWREIWSYRNWETPLNMERWPIQSRGICQYPVTQVIRWKLFTSQMSPILSLHPPTILSSTRTCPPKASHEGSHKSAVRS